MLINDLIKAFANKGSTGTVQIDQSKLSANPTLDEVLDASMLNIDMHMRPLNASQRAVMEREFKKLLNPPKKVVRPGYREFVEYLALNDDRNMIDDGGPTVCISMVAHLFQKDTDVVIADVVKYLEKNDA